MKVMTIFGTRPEIIRLSPVMKMLDKYCEHVVVHTGQNYHEGLSDVFIRELKVRTPDINLGVRSTTFGEQVGQIFTRIDNILTEHQPDKVLVLGDTNSALSAVVGGAKGNSVFHNGGRNRFFYCRV